MEFVWTTAIAMPLPVPSYMLNRAISYSVAVALSLPSSVITICSPAAAAVVPLSDTIRIPLLVVLIESVVFGKVSVPFPATVDSVWV